MRLGGALILGCLVAASTMPCAGVCPSDDHSQSMFSSHRDPGPGNGQMLLKADRIDYDLNTAVSTAVATSKSTTMGASCSRTASSTIRTAIRHGKWPRCDDGARRLGGNSPSSRLTDRNEEQCDGKFSRRSSGRMERLWLPRATRIGGVRTVATKAIYTPCKI